MAVSNTQRARQGALIAEAVREVGVLLVAFSPLDLAFADSGSRPMIAALTFFVIGLVLFGIGLRLERKNG
jgi:hypothetical protein